MRTIIELTKRDLLIFVRNKAAVFFSFLSIIIIIGLYVLFISDLQVQGIEQAMGKVEGAKALVNSWVMAGLIAVSTVTIALGSLGRIVGDRANKTLNDFLVSPIKRNYIFIAYIISTLIITFIISTILFIIAELYILSSGGQILTIIQILQVLGIIILCVLSSSLLMLFIVSFLKNEQALGVLSTIIGTLIGFITGSYIPIGIMPKGVQLVSNLIPVSQGASLLRKIFLDKPLHQVFGDTTYLAGYVKEQGIDLYIGKTELSTNFMIAFIIFSIIIFGIMNVFRFKKMKNI